MLSKQSTLQECWFLRDVASNWPETAAAHLPLVVRTDVVTAQEADVLHRHEDFFALYIVRRGRGTHVIDGIPYGVSRGDVYVMGLGVTHAYSQYDDLALDAVYFSPAIFDPPTLTARPPVFYRFSSKRLCIEWKKRAGVGAGCICRPPLMKQSPKCWRNCVPNGEREQPAAHF